MSVRALIAVAALVTACSAGSSASTPNDPDAISIGFTAEPANLDFTRTDGAAIPQALLTNVYEGLVKLDATGKIVPLLASGWTVSDDRRTYEFELRPDVTFTNGQPFTASDVKFSIDRVRTAWSISLKSKMDVVDHVEATSPTHAKVTLKRPSNNWLFDMTTRVGAMFSQSGVADLANTPVGTGPYVFASRKRGDSIVLKLNPRYWGRKPVYTTVYLKYYKDPTALNNALLSNGIDVISAITTPDSAGQFETDTRFTVLQGTTNSEVTLAFNDAKAPLNDKNIRQALTYAIDRKAVMATVAAGRGTLIGSMVPPTDPWYEDLSNLYPYDPAKARQLLNGQSLRLRLRVPNLQYALSAAQVVASQLNEVGVTVSIEPLDFPAVWLKQVFTDHDYDMSIIQHVEPRDIVTFGNPKYYWGYGNPKIPELITRGDSGSPEDQIAAMKEVARTLNADAAADWLFLFPSIIAAKTRVTGLITNQVTESFDLTALGRAP
jgi:peptide/nickel transport system substrate-binding protein